MSGMTFAVGDPVAVKKIDATHFSFKYAAANANPIVLEVNADDNSITIPSVMYGDYDGAQVTAAWVLMVQKLIHAM